MSNYCHPCLLPDMIFISEEKQVPIEQDNQWSNYLKEVSDDFVSKMKIPFGTYPKTKFYMYIDYKQRELFCFISSITSDEMAIQILNKKAEENDSIGTSPYSIIKEIAGAQTVLYKKEKIYHTTALNKWQRDFILANEGKIEVQHLSKILNVTEWVVYNFRRRKGLVKHKTYHGNRKNQEIIKH